MNNIEEFKERVKRSGHKTHRIYTRDLHHNFFGHQVTLQEVQQYLGEDFIIDKSIYLIEHDNDFIEAYCFYERPSSDFSPEEY